MVAAVPDVLSFPPLTWDPCPHKQQQGYSGPPYSQWCHPQGKNLHPISEDWAEEGGGPYSWIRSLGTLPSQ